MKKKILYLTFDETVIMDIKWILEDLGLNLKIEAIQTLPQLANTLLEEKERIILIVTDTFLPAIKDLSPIGKPEINTFNGFQAGFTILEKFLRKIPQEQIKLFGKDRPHQHFLDIKFLKIWE